MDRSLARVNGSEDPRVDQDPLGSTFFKTSEVVDLLELSRRQLQYWAKTGLIEPSARTPGGHHRYSFQDLVALKATKRLIDAGVSVQRIRQSVHALQQLFPQVGRPLGELVLVATGDVVLVFRDGTAFEAITGQEWVFPVAEFEREVAEYRSRHRGSGRPRRRRGADGEGRAWKQVSNPAPAGSGGASTAERDWSAAG